MISRGECIATCFTAGLVVLLLFFLASNFNFSNPPKAIGIFSGRVQSIQVVQGGETSPHRVVVTIAIPDGRRGTISFRTPLVGIHSGDELCVHAATAWFGEALDLRVIPPDQCVPGQAHLYLQGVKAD